MASTEPWLEWRTDEQNKLLQPACRDLSRGLLWDGVKLSQDEWRWLISADILGQKPVRGIHGGIVLLGGSSRHLKKHQASEAITLAFSIGDDPESYGLRNQYRVEWSSVVKRARGISDSDEELAWQFGV